jgi:hypothetical protein
MAARGSGLRPGLLAEQVVGHLAAPVVLHPAGGGRREVGEGVARQVAHAGRAHAERLGQVLVGLPALQHELDDRPLVGRELVEGRHVQPEG